MVRTSAFLACHQGYSAGWSLGWGLNFQAFTVAFSEACNHGFSLDTPVSSPTSLVNDSAHKIMLK